MRISNNLMAMNTHRQLSVNTLSVSKSTEKLSSGFRINRAGDDAAGLAISEKMRAQIRGLSMASKNSQDAISMIQTAEGALTEAHNILQRMRELAVQSSSDTNETTVDRAALNEEFTALKAEINDIASLTKFNDQTLLNGDLGLVTAVTTGAGQVTEGVSNILSISLTGFKDTDPSATPTTYGITFLAGTNTDDLDITFGSTTVTVANGNTNGAKTIEADFGNGQILSIEVGAGYLADDLVTGTLTNGLDFTVNGEGAQIQTGANENDNLTITIDAMDTTTLGINGAAIDTRANAESAITSVNTAINAVSTQRAELGAMQNRLEYKINSLDTAAENLQAAESRIRDLDMAAEMTQFTSSNILVQASTAMLAQANAAPQSVLQLLQ